MSPTKGGKRIDRLPHVLSALVTLIVFGVYLMTLSPGVSWAHHSEDSGDLITAAWVLGIPHPTGYPLFCIVGWIWTHLLPFGSVAWRMNALSALWGALASGITLRAIWRGFSLLPDDTLNWMGLRTRALASLSGALLLAFSLYVWEQSVVTEVYSLNLFFFSAVSWILIELLAGSREQDNAWELRRSRLVALLGLTWGFALTNHMTSLFLFPSIFTVLAFGGLGFKPRELARAALFWFLPLLLYAYLPIRSRMDPPLDYGNPETWDGFVWMVTGKQFRRSMFSLLPYQSLHQIMRYNSLPLQLGAFGAFLSGLGLIKLLIEKSRHITLLMLHSVLLVAVSLFFLASYSIWDPEGYILPMIWSAALWASWSVSLAAELPPKLGPPVKTAVIMLLAVAPLFSLVAHYNEVDLSDNYEAIRFGEESFDAFEPNALVIEVRYERAFVFWYYREVEYADSRRDVAIVYIEHTGFQWGLDLLKRKYPDLVIPDKPLGGKNPDAATAAWIVRHNIDKRPIYVGATIDELKKEGYKFQAVGLLFRVFPPDG